MARHRVHRIAMISVHTSPLDQPGTGDAGGLNVYVLETARELADRGVAVDIFTRATTHTLPPVVEHSPGVTVRHIMAGPYEGLAKEDLPGQLCAFAAGVMRTAAVAPPGHYSIAHSHYWLSGQVGWLAADRWRVPLIHTMHTMARVKNQQLAPGDVPEPPGREIGEAQVVEAADRLVANTEHEARQLVELYAADPAKVRVAAPGVDLSVFTPGNRLAARSALGLRPNAKVLLFVGRIQPLKGPDTAVRAVATLLEEHPEWADDVVLAVLGGVSGSGLRRPDELRRLVTGLGLDRQVRFEPPVSRTALAEWYRAADAVLVPSHSESFGLVAIEALASGTPVIAADVGGLPIAVGAAGLLVDGHDPHDWASRITEVLADPAGVERTRRAGIDHAAGFGWGRTADALLAIYDEALADRRTIPISESARLVGVPSAVIP